MSLLFHWLSLFVQKDFWFCRFLHRNPCTHPWLSWEVLHRHRTRLRKVCEYFSCLIFPAECWTAKYLCIYLNVNHSKHCFTIAVQYKLILLIAKPHQLCDNCLCTRTDRIGGVLSHICFCQYVLRDWRKEVCEILPRLYLAVFLCCYAWLSPLAVLRGRTYVQKLGKSQREYMALKTVAWPL